MNYFSQHRGMPYLSLWGMQTSLSYQRPGFAQADFESLAIESIDRFTKSGANYVELYPSNKETQMHSDHVEEQSAFPLHCFREFPDHDQKHQWGVADFRQFNQYAHERGFLVSWFIHCWAPGEHAKRAWAYWLLAQEIGLEVSDILAEG